MKTQADKSWYFHGAGMARGVLAPLLIGIAVILFSTAGIARMMGWGSNSTGDPGGILELDYLPVVPAKPVAATAQTAPGQVESEARATGRRCAECGVIVSTREIDASVEGADPGTAVLEKSGGTAASNRDGLREASAKRYETTIRLADRSSRVISHASPASWRPGERVIVIDGAKPSNR